MDDALSQHERWIAAERDLMGFTPSDSAAAKRLVAWLQSVDDAGQRRVEVRRYTEGFLHGKAFIAEHDRLPGVLAGSSNLTYAGLMRNVELNLGYPAGSQSYVALVRDWFEGLWEQSDPYSLDEVYAAQWEPHTPWVVFLRMLRELYADSLSDDSHPVTELGLTGFQLDGVARMTRLLDSLGGVLVADEVGLGKTFLAGEVIARASRIDRQDVLIVCPAALRTGMWEPFLRRHDFSRRVDVMSFDDLRIRSDPDREDSAAFREELDKYALVVIDEAHNLRNPAAQRSEAVNALVAGANPKKVVLLTATPVNNSLMDLHVLVSYFVRNDAAFAGIGIPSIRGYVKHAQEMDPESLSPQHLFDLMDQVAVRRTRRFVQKNYPGAEIRNPDGSTTVIKFPTPRPERLDYTLDAAGADLLGSTIYALDLPDGVPLVSTYHDRHHDPGRLMLARYAPSAYRLTRDLEAYQVSNVGLLRSALLKRLESSPAALRHTLDTLIVGHEGFLAVLDGGWVLTGSALREWIGSESEDLDEWVAQLDEELRESAEPLSEYQADELRADVAADLELLRGLRAKAGVATGAADPKAKRLVDELRKIAAEARRPASSGLDASARRKVIVFSTYADTIDDLAERVVSAVAAAPASDPLSDYQGRIADTTIKGQKTGVDQDRRARVLAWFAPETAGPLAADGTPQSQNRFDLLFTTDVLSEGVNLQQAGRIINYDLPWNPMRLVQRHGRIDRIGSKHATVTLGCFFPSEHLDTLLRLEETLQRKLAYADAAIGAGDVLPGFKSRFEVTLKDTREQIESIRAENPELFENRGPSSAALSGEEFRRRLAQALADPFVKHDVEALPWMSGSGFVNPNTRESGFVFCMRMGDHDKPWFRFVPTKPGTWELTYEQADVAVDAGSGWHYKTAAMPGGEGARSALAPVVVSDDTLTCLMVADPGGPDTARVLPDDAYRAAFGAWEAASAHALEDWLRLTDPTQLMPEVPKALRDASGLVYEHGGDALSPGEQRDLLARLNSSPPVRVQRDVRAVLNSEDSAASKIRRVRDVLLDAGVTPARAPEPLPHVEPTDVHLIAWMAVQVEL
ncbi:SNF2-related protein [Microbacterium sp.]|uniref:SNF2-related protein n=1 Tax=Microbacterium sp. TaxID=51671 RepID=UPI0027351503|nr:SNF2-related protein [Microbacterium sp.]MDP3950536.1 SNF2-related protein [Microbacterium sp.]